MRKQQQEHKDQHVPKYNLFDCLLKLNDLLSVGE